jgi:Bacterial Ig-like domain
VYLLSAKATNLGGTSAASPMVIVMVDSTAPDPPAFVSPAAGSSVAGSFTISGTAEDGSTVELFEDGASRGTIAVVGGNWSRQMSLVAPGYHSYTARAIDFAGNVSAFSATYTIRVTG